MLHNFRTASRSAEERTEALSALNDDIIALMEKGGVSALKAEPQFQMKAGALVRQSIMDTFAMTDPTPIFADRREARLGDKVEITKKHKTLRVVKYSPQSHPLMYSPVKSKYTISTSMFELPYGIELFKILTRQYEIADFVEDAAAALVRHRVELVLTGVNTACSASAKDMRGRPLRTMAGAADVDKTELDLALRRMGPGVTIFGSRYALDPIFSFGAKETDAQAEDFQKRGQIGYYRGSKMVAIEDNYNEYVGKWTEIGGKDWEKLLFIASPNKGAILLERDLSPLNWEETDSEKALFRTSVRLDHGIFVDKPFNFHVIELK